MAITKGLSINTSDMTMIYAVDGVDAAADDAAADDDDDGDGDDIAGDDDSEYDHHILWSNDKLWQTLMLIT